MREPKVKFAQKLKYTVSREFRLVALTRPFPAAASRIVPAASLQSPRLNEVRPANFISSAYENFTLLILRGDFRRLRRVDLGLECRLAKRAGV